METAVFRFSELTGEEVLKILSLREEVFVIEQNWLHKEADENDPKALHLMIREKGTILAYCRLLTLSPSEAMIGRVIAARRGEGLGRAIVELAKKTARETLCAETLFVDAQVRVKGFYETLGFTAVGEPFDEFGVPHVKMKISLSL